MNKPLFQVGDTVLVSYPKTGKRELTIDLIKPHRYSDGYSYWAGNHVFNESQVEEVRNRPESAAEDDIENDVRGEQLEVGLIGDTEFLEQNERALVLQEAERLINGQRANDYGSPQVNFTRIAKLWEPILGVEITATDVALMLTQLKIARLINSPAHRDSWIDAAGYVGLGAELAKDTK